MPNSQETSLLSTSFYQTTGDLSSNDRTRVLDLLKASSDPFDRSSYEPGHITASGIVFSPDEKNILLIFHKKLKQWIQPGGHIEKEDSNLASAARREVIEETGLKLCENFPATLLSIDIHSIPSNKEEPQHLHFDYKFGFKAQQAKLTPSREGLAMKWHPVRQLFTEQKPASVLRAVAHFRELKLS